MADLGKLTKTANRQILSNDDIALREVRRNYAEALDDIRDSLRKLYDKYASEGRLTLAEMTKYNRLVNVEKQISGILGPMFAKNERIADKIASVNYEEAYYKHTWAISQVAGFDVQFGLLRPDDIKAAVNNPLRRIAEKRLKEDGRAKINRAITQGLIRGESYTAMSKAVKDSINGSYYDAERIVRTEAGRAMTLGTKKSYNTARDAGAEVVEVWDAALDGRTRPEHARLDGREAKRHDGDFEFHTSVGWVKGPRLSGVASFDINCRCALVPTIKGYEPEARRIRDEGVQPYKTFKEWAKEKGITANRYGQKYDFVK
jgi:SPP1 gp7 family putative phage head morphogenesis protein